MRKGALLASSNCEAENQETIAPRTATETTNPEIERTSIMQTRMNTGQDSNILKENSSGKTSTENGRRLVNGRRLKVLYCNTDSLPNKLTELRTRIDNMAIPPTSLP